MHLPPRNIPNQSSIDMCVSVACVFTKHKEDRLSYQSHNCEVHKVKSDRRTNIKIHLTYVTAIRWKEG